MHYFDAWGRQIAAGDWLSKSVAVPMHGWHVNLATEHLNRHPDQLALLQAQAADDPDPDRARAMARALWTNWSGGKTFYQDPLYPYLIGATYALFGPDPRWVFLWQMLAGVFTNVLIFLIARRCFNPAVAGVSGLFAALCSPVLYYELILVRESLIAMMSMLLAGLALLVMTHPQRRWWLLTGIALGIAILLKSSFVLLGLGLTAGLAVMQWRERRRLMPTLGMLVGGLTLALSPLVARNLAVGAYPFSLASGGINTFIFHNAEDYDARIATRAEFGGYHVSRHGARIMAESQGKFVQAAIETLKTHTPSSYLSQLGHKLACVWHWYEIPNNSNYYFYRLYAWILYLPITFAAIGPLGLAGLLMGIPCWRKAWPLYLLVLCSLFPLLAFYTSSRLRLPFVVGLIPFAALPIVQVATWIQAARHLPAVLALGGTLLAATLVGRPLPKGTPRVRQSDFQVAFDIYYHPRIQRALEDGELAFAAKEYQNILASMPDHVRQLGPSRIPTGMAEATVANYFAHRLSEYAMLLHRAGQTDVAGQFLSRADEIGTALALFRKENQCGRDVDGRN